MGSEKDTEKKVTSRQKRGAFPAGIEKGQKTEKGMGKQLTPKFGR